MRLRASAAHVFVVDVEAPAIEDDDDLHHLERVLRLRPGQAVTVSDGAGAWRACRWRPGGTVEPVGEVVRDAAPSPPVTVGFALTKAERPEWVVQHLTEVGVDRIVPFVAARSVVRWDADKAARHVRRWRRVAREAAMQSRRTRLPCVVDVDGFAEAVRALGDGVTLAEPGGGPPSLRRPSVLVGPEGGWGGDESGRELPTVGLGPTILRAETAALAAGVLFCALRADLVEHSREKI